MLLEDKAGASISYSRTGLIKFIMDNGYDGSINILTRKLQRPLAAVNLETFEQL